LIETTEDTTLTQARRQGGLRELAAIVSALRMLRQKNRRAQPTQTAKTRPEHRAIHGTDTNEP
jgi:hypothetical protein